MVCKKNYRYKVACITSAYKAYTKFAIGVYNSHLLMFIVKVFKKLAENGWIEKYIY